MRDWIDVAVLAKCKNKEGRFAVKPTAGLPFMLFEGVEVAFVPPRTDVARRAVVEEVVGVGQSDEVRFEGIDGTAARDMVGMHCLIRRDEIDESFFEDSPGAWDGWRVIDGDLGEVGVVCGLVENPAQALLEVEVQGHADPVLVPVVDEIILDVDVEGRIVFVSLPAGLLDL